MKRTILALTFFIAFNSGFAHAAQTRDPVVRAEISSVKVLKNGEKWVLQYSDCKGCELIEYRINDDTEIVIDGEPSSIERARIYQKNGVYLVANRTGGFALRIEFKRR